MAVTDTQQSSKLGTAYWRLLTASGISNLGDGIGRIAYPWLASAVTRNPVLIALVVVAQRLPWLVFTLPAGVMTDRHDRRTLMVRANVARTILTAGVTFAVWNQRDNLLSPDELEGLLELETNWALYLIIVAATMLLGFAEVLYDNAGQTVMPSLVQDHQLEKANGRMWSVELVVNELIGPPLGALLLVIAFSVPFVVDGVTFALSAALIALIPRQPEKPKEPSTNTSWKKEMSEGWRWLRSHTLLWPLAVILGLLNMLGMVGNSVFILFAQDVLETSPAEFALLGTGGALGGALGGWTASNVAERIGHGRSLHVSLVGTGLTGIGVGLSPHWLVAWVFFAVFMYLAVLWNVITVSLRQSIIPDELLGRVNSAYRMLAWGMMPIGSLIGGILVFVLDGPLSASNALRAPWIIAGILNVALVFLALKPLSTERLDAARAAAGPST